MKSSPQRLAQKKAYYRANREAILARMASYRADNKETINANDRKRWHENGDNYRAAQRAYYRENRDSIRTKRKSYWSENSARFLEARGNDPKYRYMHARSTARRRALVFDIGFENYLQLIAADACAYCGFPLSKLGYSLDRIDNSIGYLPTNVVPCCKECNRARSDLVSFDEMTKHIGPAIQRIKEERLIVSFMFALSFKEPA